MGQAAVAGHLARRFFGSLSRREPSEADTKWALAWLTVGERALWARMSVADRRHAIGVAQEVAAALGPEAPRPVLAAALLHDVGKLDSRLGTFGRVGATVWASLRGRSAASAGDGAVARYLRHDAIGAQLLRDAGSDPLTVAWAAEHHRPPVTWTLPPRTAHALKAADDD